MPVNRNAISAPEPPRYFKPKKYFLLAVITANLLMILVAIFSVDIIAERAFAEKGRGGGGGGGNSSLSFSTTTTRPSRAKSIEEIERSKVGAAKLACKQTKPCSNSAFHVDHVSLSLSPCS